MLRCCTFSAFQKCIVVWCTGTCPTSLLKRSADLCGAARGARGQLQAKQGERERGGHVQSHRQDRVHYVLRQLVGHTDSQGVLEANIALSKRRTEGLTSLMASAYGVAVHSVSALGVAELATVARNHGEEGGAKNRRMELVPR